MNEVLTKIEIITRPSKFHEFREEMEKIGVSGITVTNAIGCGYEQSFSELSRVNRQQMDMLERIKIEIVVCKVPVREVVNTARKVLNTGKPGDGKIFYYEIGNAIKIRTGEEGYDALQNI